MPFDRKDWMATRGSICKGLLFGNLGCVSSILTVFFAKACQAAASKSAPEFFYCLLAVSFLVGSIVGVIGMVGWFYDAMDEL